MRYTNFDRDVPNYSMITLNILFYCKYHKFKGYLICSNTYIVFKVFALFFSLVMIRSFGFSKKNITCQSEISYFLKSMFISSTLL